MATPDILQNCPSNSLTEWRKINYLNISDISSFYTAGGYAKVNLNALSRWADIQAGSISHKDSANGSYHSHSVQVSIGNRSQQQQAVLDQLLQGRFICMLTDANGTQWIAGAPHHPLRFSYSLEQDGSTPSATILTFEGDSPYPLLPII